MNTHSRHLLDEEIERFCGQQMPPAQLLAADKHLAECDTCYGRLSELQNLSDKLIAASQAFSIITDVEMSHLSYEELAALVDNQLGDIDREVAQSHLELCRRCETELHDLRELVEQNLKTERQPLVGSRQSSFRERFLKLWQLPAFRIPAFATAAIACLALLTFLIVIPWRRENAELRAKVLELERNNQSLREQAASLESLQNEIASLREENDRLRSAGAIDNPKSIELKDGNNHITLDEQGNLAGLQTTPRYEEMVKETLRNGRVKITTPLTGASAKSGTLMGDPAQSSLRLVAPVNLIIETDRPLFRWQGLEGLATFKVSIFDESLNKIIESESLVKTQWMIGPPLRRGQTYIWQVRASTNNQEIVAPSPDSPRVKFKVLEQAKIAELENAKKTNAKSHLIMGIVYADAGLLEQAEREFNALLRANPQSPVARRLLQSVRAARR